MHYYGQERLGSGLMMEADRILGWHLEIAWHGGGIK